MRKIVMYVTAYNVVSNQGVIYLFFSNKQTPDHTLNNLSPEAYNACLSTLKNEPLYLDTNGWLRTDYEVPRD